MVEYQGTMPAERFNQVHMYQDQPFYRTPSVTSTRFGDVSFFWYMNQGDRPAVSTRGHLMDHVALSVSDLDAWIQKLTAEHVTFLEKPYTLGGLRAVMIEGPSREALELIEVK
jgi:hypothetical protein